MTDIKARLLEAADNLDHLHEGSKHIPTDLVHSDATRGLVKCADRVQPVALFYFGGAAEVFLTLGPAVLPLLAQTLRKAAEDHFGVPSETVLAACDLADHILKEKTA